MLMIDWTGCGHNHGKFYGISMPYVLGLGKIKNLKTMGQSAEILSKELQNVKQNRALFTK
jgi:hypothetical protein